MWLVYPHGDRLFITQNEEFRERCEDYSHCVDLCITALYILYSNLLVNSQPFFFPSNNRRHAPAIGDGRPEEGAGELALDRSAHPHVRGRGADAAPDPGIPLSLRSSPVSGLAAGPSLRLPDLLIVGR